MSSLNQATIPDSNGAVAGGGAMEKAPVATPQALTATDRAEFIQRMLRDALDEPSPVTANLQMNGGDLLEMSLVLKRSIMEATKSSSEVGELKELQPFMETYLRICRQADRVLRLKHEITQTQRGSSLGRSARKGRAGE